MSQDITITLSMEMKLFLSEKAKKQNRPLKNTIEQLIHEQINNKIYFDEGYYFDRLKNKLFNADGKIIEFTKLQSGVFNFLLEKNNEIVSFETIHKEVWKNKEMSIFTMRNVVKRIRDMTYYGIIVNHSNIGYSIGVISN